MTWLKRLRWTFVGLGLVIAAAMTYLALNSHWIKIERIEISLMASSNEDLIYQRVRKSLTPQFQRYAGKFFWEVPLHTIFEITTKDKRVRRVSVSREFPSTIRVEIEPHTPVLAYLGNDNRIYPVATDATLLPALLVKEAPDLPIIRGDELKDEQKLRETALELFEQIPQEGSLRRKNISEIYYSKKEGFKIYVADPTAEVKLGDADFGPKVSRVEKVLSYLESQNIKGRVIDARFAKKVVVRVRKGP